MKPLLPLVLIAALVPGAPAHAAPASPFKVLRKVDGTPSRIVMTGPKSGFAFFVRRDPERPLAYRWNGGTWRPSPLPGGFGGAVNLEVEAAASGPGNVWALRSTVVATPEGDGPARSGLIRWTGTRWKTVKIALPGGASRWEPTSLDVQGERVTVAFSTKRSDEKGIPLKGESRIASWDGRRWRVEKPGPARGKVLQTAVPDGRGGMWALGSDPVVFNEGDRLYHRNAKGRWTTRALPYENLNIRPLDLVRLPGSTRLIGVADTYLVYEYGRIIVTR